MSNATTHQECKKKGHGLCEIITLIVILLLFLCLGAYLLYTHVKRTPVVEPEDPEFVIHEPYLKKLCQEKGNYNSVTQKCECDEGWFGKYCQYETYRGCNHGAHFPILVDIFSAKEFHTDHEFYNEDESECIIGKRLCLCSPGFSGQMCKQKDSDTPDTSDMIIVIQSKKDLLKHICQENGQYDDREQKCKCDDAFGTYCQYKKNEEKCKNHGALVVKTPLTDSSITNDKTKCLTESSVCHCEDQYFGKDCSFTCTGRNGIIANQAQLIDKRINGADKTCECTGDYTRNYNTGLCVKKDRDSYCSSKGTYNPTSGMCDCDGENDSFKNLPGTHLCDSGNDNKECKKRFDQYCSCYHGEKMPDGCFCLVNQDRTRNFMGC